MRKYLFKIFVAICLLSLLIFSTYLVNAEPITTNDVVPPEETVENTTKETNTENVVVEEETTNSDDIYTEETEKPSQQVQPSSVDYSITGVKSINGLPEANLELNNILNIILIAIGFLLILFAIALLIRIGK